MLTELTFPPDVRGDSSPQTSPRMPLISYVLECVVSCVQTEGQVPPTPGLKAMNRPHDSCTLLIISSGFSSSVPHPTLGHYKRMVFLPPE